jgi:hypothetical protein
MTDLEAAELLRYMQRWGYDINAQPHPRSPGYGRLVVAMRRVPTEEHYDPESIHLQLVGPQGFAMRHTIQRDSNLFSDKVAPGRLELTDRVNQRLGFFTYGATVDMGRTEDETVVEIRSPVPILELRGSLDESISEQLVSETEALWAKVRAQWGTDDAGFMRRLSAVQPSVLYATTIHSLLTYYKDSGILRQTFPQFYSMLRREDEWLKSQGMSAMAAQSLDEIVHP